MTQEREELSGVEGLATVQIDPARQQLIGLRTAPVTAGPVKDVVFDLERLKFISSAGLRVFSSTRKLLKARSEKPAALPVRVRNSLRDTSEGSVMPLPVKCWRKRYEMRRDGTRTKERGGKKTGVNSEG